MKIYYLITVFLSLFTSSLFCNEGGTFVVKPFHFDFTYSWDAKLLHVKTKTQISYLSKDNKTIIELKDQKGSIKDKKQGNAKVNIELLSFPIRSTGSLYKSLKRIKYSLVFTFEKQGRQFEIEIDYPFYRRNLETPQLFMKLPTHHRILKRRLHGLAFDLTDSESQIKKIFNEKRRDWLECSSYLINDGSELFDQNFRSRYELVDEAK
ncbi:MAG: hypothetical protein KC646_08225 [Candidatus Cloacimonetes bacterium]|nr:hypothetical protein [Candidatus Cloacimonadota bacterium]